MSEFTTPSKNPQGRKWVLRVFDGFCVRFDGFCVRFAGVFGSTFFSVNSVSCVCFCFEGVDIKTEWRLATPA